MNPTPRTPRTWQPRLNTTRTQLRQKLSGQEGFSAVEVVMLTPVAFAFMVLLAFAAVLWEARIEVNAVAQQAARAASMSRSTADANAAANTVAAAALADRCDGGLTATITQNATLTPGQDVAVDISCSVNTGLFRVVFAGGTVNVTGQARSLVETYKGT